VPSGGRTATRSSSVAPPPPAPRLHSTADALPAACRPAPLRVHPLPIEHTPARGRTAGPSLVSTIGNPP
jgi:hypothetical protein